MTSHKPDPCDGEALLARLHNNHVHKFVVKTEDKLRAHMAGAIEAARARGLAPVFNFVDDELVEPAPQPAPRRSKGGAPKPHRTRTPSLTKALREAKKAGIPVTGATFTADSVSLSFGEAAKSNGNDLDQWLAGHHENPTKGH
jgi:hypothetical protein